LTDAHAWLYLFSVVYSFISSSVSTFQVKFLWQPKDPINTLFQEVKK